MLYPVEVLDLSQELEGDVIALGRHEADAGNAAQGIDVGGDAVPDLGSDIESEEEAHGDIVVVESL